jgi:hydroxymethylbilane synthase
MDKIIIGTRGSALALVQAEITKKLILEKSPACTVELRIIKTTGDINTAPIPLDTVGKGWFTKEIEDELLRGTIDCAVHSLKDMALECPSGLSIVAMLAREDARDVLVSKQNETLNQLKPKSVVGTDSTRRQVQLQSLRPDLVVKSVRGNVGTRLSKLDSGEYDALVLAAAGLVRLGFEKRISEYFEIAEFMPAPGQGILALEAKTDRKDLVDFLLSLTDPFAYLCGRAERAFSKALGGGCKKPVGAYATLIGDSITLEGMMYIGGNVVRKSVSGNMNEPEKVGIDLAKIIQKK